MKMIAMAVDGQGLVHLAATRAPDLWRRELARSTGSARLAFVGLAPDQLTADTVLDRVAHRLARQAAQGPRRRLAGRDADIRNDGCCGPRDGGNAQADSCSTAVARSANRLPAEVTTEPAGGPTGVPRARVYGLAPDRILRVLNWELGGALRLAALTQSFGRTKRRLVRMLRRLSHTIRRREHVMRQLFDFRRG